LPEIGASAKLVSLLSRLSNEEDGLKKFYQWREFLHATKFRAIDRMMKM